MAYQIPEDLRYSKTHEWARLEGDTVVVGITDYAQSHLGDIVYVELPEVGESYAQGATFGVVESVKATSDLYAPMGGTVLAVNETLADDPAVINRDPYGEGWLVRISVANPAEWETLLDAVAYARFLEEEGGH
ncbi:MAG: glycine cleavage system protein GcvH [Chloroflexia bacterium]